MSAKISIITPTYNEKESIVRFVKEISKMMNSLNPQFQIIVVDDNSPDGTAEVVTGLKTQYPNVKLIKRSGKLGIGSAYFTGFSQASGDYLIGIDADLSPSLNAIPAFITKLEAGDGMVVGSRYLPASRSINMSPFKSGGSRLFNLFAQWALNIPLTDITHSNRAFTKEAFQNIAPRITAKDHPAFFVECSFWANKLGYPISEVPITFTERTTGQSKLNIKKGLSNAIKTVSRLRKVQ